jgi:hypothetical protein
MLFKFHKSASGRVLPEIYLINAQIVTPLWMFYLTLCYSQSGLLDTTGGHQKENQNKGYEEALGFCSHDLIPFMFFIILCTLGQTFADF